jgi:hypothetical protein
VFAALDRRFRQTIVGVERRGDRDGVQIISRQKCRIVVARPHAGMPSPGRVKTLGPRIGNRCKLDPARLRQIAGDIGTPVSVADQANLNHNAKPPRL